MSRAFADATAVEVVRRTEEVVVLRGVVQPGWDIGGNANGGYLLAIAGRAMATAVGRPPLTLTSHYVRPAPAGACEIEVRPVKVGRRLATATATFSIGGLQVLQLVGGFGEQIPGGPTHVEELPPELPAFEACETRPAEVEEGFRPELMNRLDVRMPPGADGFRVGRPSGRAEMTGWFALGAEEPIDVFGLLLAVDAFAPPVFNLDLPTAWVPTIELTAHIRGVPAPGPVRCSFRSRFVQDGLVDEEGVIWDSDDRLVAQSRQLSLLPRG
jgi:acyl-coenzyme A thioesterase PaaI-like protein